MGKLNHQIIENITRNIIKNSLGHDYLAMDEEVFAAVDAMRRENYEKIYKSDEVAGRITFGAAHDGAHVHDLRRRYSHGSRGVTHIRHYLDQPMLRYPYSFELEFRPEDIAVDYIASMTDDYFVDLYAFLFPTTR